MNSKKSKPPSVNDANRQEGLPPASPDDAACAVDTHFHVFAAHGAVPGARYVPGYDAALSDWQQLARGSGVGRGVLVQTSFMGTDNRRLLAELVAHPHELRGVAVVAPDATLATLQPLHAQGVRGIRLNLAGASHDMTAWSQATSLWDALLHLGWHLELHTDRGALPQVVATLPQALTLVIDHFGTPARDTVQDETVKALVRRSRQSLLAPTQPDGQPHVPAVHIKLSATYRLGGLPPQTLARLWLGELGPQALLWGSDWPCTNHEPCADYALLASALATWLDHDVGVLAAVRTANPMRLYWSAPIHEVACE